MSSSAIRWFNSDDSCLGRFIVVLWDFDVKFNSEANLGDKISRTINFYGRIGSRFIRWKIIILNFSLQKTTSGPIKQRKQRREIWSDLIRQQKFPSEFFLMKKVRKERRRRSIIEGFVKAGGKQKKGTRPAYLWEFSWRRPVFSLLSSPHPLLGVLVEYQFHFLCPLVFPSFNDASPSGKLN